MKYLVNFAPCYCNLRKTADRDRCRSFFVNNSEGQLKLVKGTVARDFLLLFFFHKLTSYGPLINTLKYFRIQFRIRGDIRIRR